MMKQTPMIGILSGTHQHQPFSGDKQFFENIQRECIKNGGISFVFTPSGIQSETLEGFLFENDRWKRKKFPYPHLVYNRLPSHSLENSKQIQSFFHTLKNLNIPFFNRKFIDKWDAYTTLNNGEHFLIRLPKTELLTDTETAVLFLKTYSFIYVKPTRGKMGKGIFTLTYHNENDSLLTTHQTAKKITIDHVRHIFSHLLRHRHETYILQQGIIPDEYKKQKYDFRILLVRTDSDWNVIGIGVRAADKNRITTHTVRGGKLLPLKLVTSTNDIENLTAMAKQIASQLAKKEQILRECSLDIGKDKNGNYWMFEINTKPMAFDERDIETKRISELAKTFFHLINDSSGIHF